MATPQPLSVLGAEQLGVHQHAIVTPPNAAAQHGTDLLLGSDLLRRSVRLAVHRRGEVPGHDRAMPPGSRETGVLTIEQSGNTPILTGTFADFGGFYPTDLSNTPGPYSGVLSGTFDCLGRVVLELRNDQQHAFWRGKGTVDGGRIVGDFSSAVFGGTFTADPVPSR